MSRKPLNRVQRERAEFAAYLAALTDAQVQGVLDKETAANRRDFADMARAEQARREANPAARRPSNPANR